MQQQPADLLIRGVLSSTFLVDGHRLPAAYRAKLPMDTVAASRVPAGVNFAFTTTASVVELDVSVGAPTPVPAPGAPAAFMLVCGSTSIGVPLDPDRGEMQRLRVVLPRRDPDAVVYLYWPEAFSITVHSLLADARLEPVQQPKWVAYGDSITQGWSVSEPGLSWPARVGRACGLDVINLGFAGSARGEATAARVIADSGADVVSIAWGTNSWGSLPTDVGAIRETMRLFLTTARSGLPGTPMVVLSPLLRPDAEGRPNEYGSTLAQLRTALEEAVHAAVAAGDTRLDLISGLGLVNRGNMPDGLHPNDQGAGLVADAVGAWMEGTLASGSAA